MPSTLPRLLPRERLNGSPTRTPASYPSGTLWPHGEWSLGYGKRRGDGGAWHEDPFVGLGVDDVAMAERASRGDSPLNLSDAPNSTIRPARGLKGMTGYGQQMIKACGHLLQQRWPRHRKTLGTVTLPPMSQQARVEVVQAWPTLTREWLRWLTRRLERQGLPPVVCSATEVQPKRLQAQNEGCLHWHTLWLNHPGRAGNWAVDPCDVRTWVDGALRRHCPSYQGGHVNVNTKPVEGVVAAYMAKYMSKGKQMVSEAVKDWGDDLCPRQWWNMTKPARDMVKAATLKGEAVGESLEVALETGWSIGPGKLFSFLRHIEIDFDGQQITVGWRGRFLPAVDKRIRQGLQSPDIG